MPQKLADKATSSLVGAITNTATSLSVQSADSELFPVANTNANPITSALDWFKLVVEKNNGQYEIMYVRTRAGASPVFSNILRGQDGTTALAFSAGDIAEIRLVKSDINAVLGGVFSAGAYTPLVSVPFFTNQTIDASQSNAFEFATLTANTDITFANLSPGQTISVRFKQDATGNRAIQLPSTAAVAGSPNFAANSVSRLIVCFSTAGNRVEGIWSQLP